MRRVHLLLALALLALVLALWWSTRSPGGAAPIRPAAVVEAPPQAAPQAEPQLADPAPARSRAAIETVEDEPASAPAAAVALPMCAVLGRVADGEGRPLADVLVRASAYRTWREGAEVPRVEERYDGRGFEARSDANGAFRIDAPVPTAELVVVRVRPDRFHDSWDTRLGSNSSCDGPPLAEGPRDLGEIRLAEAGAIRGRVTDESGAPLAEVELGTGPEPNLTYQRGAHSAPDGGYLIPHALVGTYGVKAKLEGYLGEFRAPVTVDAGQDTLGVDFVLRAAPSVEGVVVDELGQPIEGAKLWGWPQSSGSGAGAKSGADGRFVVYLPQEEPYRFTVERDGFLTWDDETAEDTVLEPGERDVRIVMRSVPRTRFLVVDAKSGEPIERYGIGILENNGSRSKRHIYTEKRPPRLEPRPGGVAELTARPGVDQYIVAAEGYLLRYDDVEHASDTDPSQTIRLQRSGLVRAQVLRDGAPVEGASVTLLGSRGSGADVRVERNEQATGLTDAQGRFALPAPTRGQHRLIVAPKEGAPLVVDGVQAVPGEERDLGQLELLPGASVDGRVLLPPGIDPAGLTVFLGHWQEDVKTVTDAEGRFRFEALAAGETTVTLDDRPGVLAGGASAALELRAGQESAVTIDAREFGVCEVTLRLDLGGLPVAELQVDLVRADGGRERARLGRTDETGLVHGYARAWGEARAQVFLDGFREHPARFELTAGGAIDELLRFELATLRLYLPPNVSLPQQGRLRLTLEPAGDPSGGESISIAFTKGEPDATHGLAALVDGGVELRAVPAGRWSARVELFEASAEGGFLLGEPTFTATAPLDLSPGATVELRL